MDRALLTGINRYPEMPLYQCVRDVRRTLDGIQRLFGFDPAGIRLLCDERATTENILTRLRWLVDGVKPGDRLLFHYSGHGCQMASRNDAGEVDGLDECICPVDFDWSEKHVIRDNAFSEIFASVPEGVEFIWISDSCHSGDLQRSLGSPAGRRLTPPEDIAWRNEVARRNGYTPRRLRESADMLNCALISACADHETASETGDGGALTVALWEVLEDIPKLPLNQVVRKTARRVKGQTVSIAGPERILSRPFLGRQTANAR